MAPSPEQFPRRFGPYVLLDLLGRGGAANAFVAHPVDVDLPSPLVVKCLRGHLTAPDHLSRFRHEAMIATSISSPNVVRVFDVGEVSGTLYIAMELLSGWEVSRILEALSTEERMPSVLAVVELIRGALRGLDALHNASDPVTGEPLGVVHRDLSPRNMIVDEHGVLRLIDLGIGKSNAQTWKTQTGLVLGSPGYMAPEQAAAGRVDHRTDLYAIGVVLHELLTVRQYIARSSLAKMLEHMRSPVFSPPSAVREDVPGALDRVLERALAIEPEARFGSAREMLVALEDAVPRGDVTQPPIATLVGERLVRELERERAMIAELYGARTDVTEAPTEAKTISFARRTHTSIATVATGVSVATIDDPTAPGATLPVRDTVMLDAKSAPKRSGATLPTILAVTLAAAALALVFAAQRRPPDEARVQANDAPRAVALPAAAPAPAAAKREAESSNELQDPRRTEAESSPSSQAPRRTENETSEASRHAEGETSAAPRRAESEPSRGPRRSEPETSATPRRNVDAQPNTVAPPAQLDDPAGELRSLTALAFEKRRDHPDRAQAIDEILANASLWARSKDRATAIQKLRELRATLASMH